MIQSKVLLKVKIRYLGPGIKSGKSRQPLQNRRHIKISTNLSCTPKIKTVKFRELFRFGGILKHWYLLVCHQTLIQSRKGHTSTCLSHRLED